MYKSPCTRTGLIVLPSVSNGPNKRGTTCSTHCRPNSSISESAPLLRLSSSNIAWRRCFAKNCAHDDSQSFGIFVEPQQVGTWNPYFPFGDVYEWSFASSVACALAFIEDERLWKVQRKKWPPEEERAPWPIGVGQRPGTAREISCRDSWFESWTGIYTYSPLNITAASSPRPDCSETLWRNPSMYLHEILFVCPIGELDNELPGGREWAVSADIVRYNLGTFRKNYSGED